MDAAPSGRRFLLGAQITSRRISPFSRNSGVRLVFGEIGGEDNLRLESHMPENGVVFSDGIESDFLAFNSGTVLTVGVAAECGQLIVH